MQQRYFQTLAEISRDKSNTIDFPLSIDLIESLME
jgi:hypothetical protein